jgi:hypothetical protein
MEKKKTIIIASKIVHLLVREGVSALEATKMLKKANSIYSRRRYRFLAHRGNGNERKGDTLANSIVGVLQNPRVVLKKKISTREAREILIYAQNTYLERSYHELCKVKAD